MIRRTRAYFCPVMQRAAHRCDRSACAARPEPPEIAAVDAPDAHQPVSRALHGTPTSARHPALARARASRMPPERRGGRGSSHALRLEPLARLAVQDLDVGAPILFCGSRSAIAVLVDLACNEAHAVEDDRRASRTTATTIQLGAINLEVRRQLVGSAHRGRHPDRLSSSITPAICEGGTAQHRTLDGREETRLLLATVEAEAARTHSSPNARGNRQFAMASAMGENDRCFA